ncbi:MAG: hypothetical protein ACP5O1_04740 [Phycisphaerae bacterium]
MFHQLNPTIHIRCSRGEGYAVAVIDYGQAHHLLWVVALNPSGEVWCLTNSEITLQINGSVGRTPSPEQYHGGQGLKIERPLNRRQLNGDRLITGGSNDARTSS